MNMTRFIDPITDISENEDGVKGKCETNKAVFQKWIIFSEEIGVNVVIIFPSTDPLKPTEYALVNNYENGDETTTRPTVFIVRKGTHDFRPLRESERGHYNMRTILEQPHNFARWKIQYIVERQMSHFTVAQLREFLDTQETTTASGTKITKLDLLTKYISSFPFGNLLNNC